MRRELVKMRDNLASIGRSSKNQGIRSSSLSQVDNLNTKMTNGVQ